jgi:hypothetical protein
MSVLEHRDLLPQRQVCEREISATPKGRSEHASEDSEPPEHDQKANVARRQKAIKSSRTNYW